MSPDSVFRIPDHVVARRIGGETVILDLDSGTYFGLDPVGARIWDLIGDGKSLGEIRAALLAEYDVGEEELAADTERLLAELRSNGLVV